MNFFNRFDLTFRGHKNRRRSTTKDGRSVPTIETLESRQMLATLTVNSLEDNVFSDDGLVTLREAIYAANDNSLTDLGEQGTGNDQIVFDPSIQGGRIDLRIADSFGLGPTALDIHRSISILGGTGGITIGRDTSSNFLGEENTPLLRIFDVLPDASLRLNNVTIADGRALGNTGGIGGRGGAGGGEAGVGGAILNDGLLIITSSTFVGNVAIGGEGGTTRHENIGDSPFDGGHGAGRSGGAGSGRNDGDGDNGGRFSGGGGGGHSGSGDDDGDGGNGGFGGGGGGGGGASGEGGFFGGLFVHAGEGGSGGTFGGDGVDGQEINPCCFGFGGAGGGGAGLGGAIFNMGSVVVINSTFSGNGAFGGAGGLAALEGDPGPSPNGQNGSGQGGAIFNFEGEVGIYSSTISHNSADEGGSVTNYNGDAEIYSTILANSFGASSDFHGVGNQTTRGAFNLFEGNDGFSGSNLIIADPQLEPLQHNDGPTQTHRPRRGSPVVDAGNNVRGVSRDQRGFPYDRTIGNSPDIGAYERLNTIAPEAPFDGLGIANETFEGAPNGSTVGIQLGTETAAGDTASFQLVDDADGRFQVNPVSGIVTVADGSRLDHEAQSVWTISAIAIDQEGDVSGASSFSIFIRNEVHTVRDGNSQPNVVFEGAEVGAEVGVTATSAEPGGGIEFRLTNDAGGRFQIDQNSGVVSVASPDLVVGTTHPITIQAWLGSSLQSTFSTSIRVERDPFTPFDIDPIFNGVEQGSDSGTPVGITLESIAPSGESVRYFLTDDTDGRFFIDRITGVVSVRNSDTLGSYTITALAETDDGEISAEATFMIRIGGNVAFVDDDFAGINQGEDPDGPGPATSFGVDAFATIQDAVDAVIESGVIHVYPGVYDENVLVQKSILLDGTSGDASDVVINPPIGDGVAITTGNAVIRDLRIQDTDNGIVHSGGGDLTLENIELNSLDLGLQINGGGNIELSQVHATQNRSGLSGNAVNSVSIDGSSASDNREAGITFSSVAGTLTLTDTVANDNRDGSGLLVLSAGSLSIVRGSYSGNSASGISLGTITGGVQLTGATSNQNSGNGLSLFGSAASVSITGGSFSNNGTDAFSGGDGVSIADVSGEVAITSATADNNESGFNLSRVGTVTLSDISANNNFSHSGLQVLDSGALTITNSSFSDNAMSGIGLLNLQNARLTDVRVSRNNDHGIQLDRIAGDVSIIQSTLEDNDANHDGIGNGLNATNDDEFAVGGSLEILGSTIRDTDGTGDVAHQSEGIHVNGVGGQVTIADYATPGATLVSGHDNDAARFNRVGGLMLSNSNFQNNRLGVQVSNANGAVRLDSVSIDRNGYGLQVLGTAPSVTVDSSAIINNQGTGISSPANLIVTNSTISGNRSFNFGGGIIAGGSLEINNSTITANQGSGGGGIHSTSDRQLILHSTIVAENTNRRNSPSDLMGTLDGASSFNLIGIGDGLSGITDDQNGNQIGTADNLVDPHLGPLQNNGGVTLSHALLAGSPAINAGSNPLNLSNDQRGSGFGRVLNGSADIGAFEVQGATLAIDTRSLSVVENQTSIGQIAVAMGGSPGSLNGLRFRITQNGADDARFAITPAGELSFIAAPDFENPNDVGGVVGDNLYEVEIRVQDSNGASDTATISVVVDPTNDHSPFFTSPNIVDTPERSLVVQSLVATDADLPAQLVTFSIRGTGVDDSLFQITNGNLLEFRAAPDFENAEDTNSDNVYEVNIEASDGNGMSTLQTVFVTVTRSNEDAPVFTSADMAEVAENTTTVQVLSATDIDQPVTFSVSGNGADDDLFEIVSGNQLEFRRAPDFEIPADANGDNIYVVEVEASDADGLAATQTVFVAVGPVNDNSPIITSDSSVEVPENSTIVQSITATDSDQPTQLLTYAIIESSADASLFRITQSNQLEFRTPPEFGNPQDSNRDNIYFVEVEVNDLFGETASQSITVQVTPSEGQFYDFGQPEFSARELDATHTTNLVTVTRSGQTDVNSRVDVLLSGGTASMADFVPGQISLNFQAGETSKTVPIEILGENLVETDETINLSFANFSNGGSSGGAIPTSVFTIVNDEVATLSLSDAEVVEGDEGTTSAFLFAFLDKPVASSISIEYTPVSGTATPSIDFQPTTGRFTIPAGSTSVSIPIQVIGDTEVESDEEIVLRANFSRSSEIPVLFTDTDSHVTILDNDALRVVGVKVGSSRWTSAFRALIDPTGGDFGYLIPTAPQTLAPLPWANMDQIQIEYNGDIGDRFAADLFGLGGVRIADYRRNFLNMAYNPDNFTVTITLNQFLGDDKLVLVASDVLTQDSGSMLNRESSTSSSDVDDRIFQIRFDVLPGDVNQSGEIQSNDGFAILQRQLQDIGDENYLPLADIDGSGSISANDGFFALQRQSTSLPDGSPTAPAISRADLAMAVLAELEEEGGRVKEEG